MDDEYEYRVDPDGSIECCHCCEWPAPVMDIPMGHLRTYDSDADRLVPVCEICSTTFTRCEDAGRMLAQVANLLLDKITHRRPDEHYDPTPEESTS